MAKRPPEPSDPEVSMTTMNGPHSGVDRASVRVIEDAEGWQQLWKKTLRQAPPSFDPEKQSAVAVFLGSRNTGGYSVELSVSREGDDLIVHWEERKPSPSGFVIQAFTSPYAVGVFDRPPGRVRVGPDR